MTVMIERSPDEERQLHERASRVGQDVTAYLRRLIREDLGSNRTFAEILAPIHREFRESGLSGEELDKLLVDALAESRADRRTIRSKTSPRSRRL